MSLLSFLWKKIRIGRKDKYPPFLPLMIASRGTILGVKTTEAAYYGTVSMVCGYEVFMSIGDRVLSIDSREVIGIFE